MSRQSTIAPRNLTLTEELEKLEQSITLTLQEIDHNFSKAHRIVTSSILPIVDQYAEHSKNVWEGSKFWKQFFEASANVSLSGYEEPPGEDETVTEASTASAATPSTSTYDSPPQPSDQSLTPQTHRLYENDEDITLSPSPAHSTPRAPHPTAQHAKPPAPTTAPYSSPYEVLKRDHLPSHPAPSDSTLPSTPRALSPSKSHDLGPQSSPFAPPSTSAHASHRTPANDVLLHRILDKNWRLQATPHSTARDLPYRPSGAAPGTARKTPGKDTTRRGRFPDPITDDLDSSPVIAAPQLHAEIFDTPARKGRIPGVSVLTPATARKKFGTAGESRGAENGKSRDREELWDSDSDEDEELAGMSPPKTMQFHIPKGQLVRTPAREASKRIVEDLLLTAGGNITSDLDEESPSVVKRSGALEDDDTF